ncbi:MAG: hypothetical protein E7277_09405 [Lachnospiraceae bacterium]|jgi:flagellar biosynthesis GTPase FlhF|nr:hypothetical protein [Lachnospiraceae bacterium]
MGGFLSALIVFLIFLANASSQNKKKQQQQNQHNEPQPVTRKPNQTRKEVLVEKKRQLEKQMYEAKEREMAKAKERERADEKRRREIAKRDEERKKKMEEQARQGDILDRSSQAVSEDFSQDQLKEESGKHEQCSIGHYEESEDSMKTVMDLMVMGPNCTISYERDFVAEGEKLISTLGRK